MIANSPDVTTSVVSIALAARSAANRAVFLVFINIMVKWKDAGGPAWWTDSDRLLTWVIAEWDQTVGGRRSAAAPFKAWA